MGTLILAAAASLCGGVAQAQTGAEAVYAWGDNNFGQIGNGESELGGGETEGYVHVPTRVLGPGGVGYLTSVVSVAAGTTHTIAALADGSVYTWGSNEQGELGVGTWGTGLYSETPVQVLAPAGEEGHLTGIIAVAAGDDYSVALKGDGTVWTWGNNFHGALGNDDTIDRVCRPVQVVAPLDEQPTEEFLGGIIAISAGPSLLGNTSLALRADGTVIAWGDNGFGQLGIDETGNFKRTPVKALLPTLGAVVTQIACDGCVSTALRQDGTALAWGWAGCPGFSSQNSHPLPVPIVGPGGLGVMDNITAITPWAVVRSDGSAWSWGWASYWDYPHQIEGPWGIGSVSNAASITTPAVTPGDFYPVWQHPYASILRSDGSVWLYDVGNYCGNCIGLWPALRMTGIQSIHSSGIHSVALKNGPVLTFTLTVQSSPSGAATFSVEPNQVQYEFGELVTVEVADYDFGWAWQNWTGDLVPEPEYTGNYEENLEQELFMTCNRTVVANFDEAVDLTIEHIRVPTPTYWVYQNTPNLRTNGGHAVRVTATVTDLAGNNSASLSVSKVPGSGNGEVTIEDDPESNPLVKYVYGSMRTDGATGTGNLTLQITVSGDVDGQVTEQVSFKCRRLGDINGNGGVEPSDMSLLINCLNNMTPPPGFDDRMYDLDANGGAEPTDLSLLINILNGLPIP
ncbi:MAG: hypothetical protein JXL80_14425 [Planctomycetes bacterium]|nr:hypothetical protein [Planctomycetota bacterium]